MAEVGGVEERREERPRLLGPSGERRTENWASGRTYAVFYVHIHPHSPSTECHLDSDDAAAVTTVVAAYARLPARFVVANEPQAGICSIRMRVYFAIEGEEYGTSPDVDGIRPMLWLPPIDPAPSAAASFCDSLLRRVGNDRDAFHGAVMNRTDCMGEEEKRTSGVSLSGSPVPSVPPPDSHAVVYFHGSLDDNNDDGGAGAGGSANTTKARDVGPTVTPVVAWVALAIVTLITAFGTAYLLHRKGKCGPGRSAATAAVGSSDDAGRRSGDGELLSGGLDVESGGASARSQRPRRASLAEHRHARSASSEHDDDPAEERVWAAASGTLDVIHDGPHVLRKEKHTLASPPAPLPLGADSGAANVYDDDSSNDASGAGRGYGGGGPGRSRANDDGTPESERRYSENLSGALYDAGAVATGPDGIPARSVVSRAIQQQLQGSQDAQGGPRRLTTTVGLFPQKSQQRLVFTDAATGRQRSASEADAPTLAAAAAEGNTSALPSNGSDDDTPTVTGERYALPAPPTDPASPLPRRQGRATTAIGVTQLNLADLRPNPHALSSSAAASGEQPAPSSSGSRFLLSPKPTPHPDVVLLPE
jgi:hypothetical protein